MHTIRVGSADYLIGATSAVSSYEGAAEIHDVSSAQSVLQHSVGDHYAMRMLRILIDERLHTEVNLLDDIAVVELAARMVSASHLFLIGPTTPLRKGKVLAGPPGAASAAAAPPSPRPAQPASRSAPMEAVEPSFVADLDAALLATMLRDAAKDGTPFCEECARAARAA